MRWLAGTLLALLALAYAIVRLGSPSADVRPAPDDAGLGGLSLFARALRDAGYRVAFDPASRPRLAKDDVAVVPLMRTQRVPKPVLDHVARGGRAYVLVVPEELQPVRGKRTLHDRKDREATVDETAFPGVVDPTERLASVAVWYDDQDTFATLSRVGEGRLAYLDGGALATNRFLGRRDNARVVFATLSALRVNPGERLAFLALGYGEAEDLGPIEAIGPWAVGALWQSLAVLGAFGIARGIRFGLPEPERRRRRGSRELLDALAGHYRRGRRTDAALLAAARERPDDPELGALAGRAKVSEDEARRVLAEVEARPRKRR